MPGQQIISPTPSGYVEIPLPDADRGYIQLRDIGAPPVSYQYKGGLGLGYFGDGYLHQIMFKPLYLAAIQITYLELARDFPYGSVRMQVFTRPGNLYLLRWG